MEEFKLCSFLSLGARGMKGMATRERFLAYTPFDGHYKRMVK